jgi:aldose 1-epimerase
MRRFSFQNSEFFGFSTVVLTDNETQNNVEIALRGANVLKYNILKDNKLTNIIAGFEEKEEFINGTGARSFIMAPYSNKISDDEYEFEGEKYELTPDVPGKSMRHGLVAKADFEILSVNLFDDHIEITFFTECLRSKNNKGYPFDVDVFAQYKFFGNKLEVEISGKNIGAEAAPFGAGWHSYLRTCDYGVDHLHLELNAESIILVDPNQVPLKGDAAFAPVDEHKEIDFRSARPLEERKFGSRPVNVCFSNLTEKKGDFYETKISDFENNIELTIFQQSGVTYVFTGDGLLFRPRKSVAVEPVEFMTDSYNRKECSEQIKLPPGKTKKFTFGLKVKY